MRRTASASDSIDYRRLLAVIWPFLGIVMLMLVLAAISMDMVSGARAYVAGEGFWSKGQKQATAALERYTYTLDAADYAAFLSAIDVALGDREARIELEKRRPDFVVARNGLRRGQNHVDDIPAMIRLFRNFRAVGDVDLAIEVWTRADELIMQLIAHGQSIHEQIQAGRNSAQLQAARLRIREFDAQLTPLEVAFSATLGELSRRIHVSLSLALFLIAAILVLFASLRTRRLLLENDAFQRASSRNEQRFLRAVSGASDGLWDWDRLEQQLYLSPHLLELLDLDSSAAPQSPADLLARLHPEDRDVVLRVVRLHIRRGVRIAIECRIRRRDGAYVWVRLNGFAERCTLGKVRRLSGAVGDITDRKRAEAQLYAAKERAEVTLASIGDAVISTDIHGAVEYLNPVAEALTGWSYLQAQGLPLALVCDIDDEATGASARDPVEAVLRERGTVTLGTKLLLRRRGGGSTPIDETATPIRDREGEIDGIVLVFRDVSRERRYSEALSFQASHDLLTGLYNRAEFERRLDYALQLIRTQQRPHALLYLDLDQFKLVNDTAGHAAGDELLRQIGRMLQANVRENDIVARLGGDEFAVLLDNCCSEAALNVAQKLRQCIADHSFHCGQRSFVARASIGLIDLGSAPLTRDDVLGLADSACYVAKDQGRDRVHRYHPDDALLALRRGEMEWVDRLHRALQQGALRLYRQEIRPLSGAAQGSHFEVLLRLEEDGRTVPPMAFIPAAERYGLMPLIDRWVIRASFHRIDMARRTGSETIALCAINLSGASLADDGFVDYVKAQLDDCNIDPAVICFEITETVAIADLARAASFVSQLRDLGCRFALDDFGVGMSSFTYLKTLPVDFLKIDGSFVRDMRRDRIDRAMVEAMHRIGQVMGKATIAEMVEDEATVNDVRAIGIDFAQGFAIAQPRPFIVCGSAADPAPMPPRSATGYSVKDPRP